MEAHCRQNDLMVKLQFLHDIVCYLHARTDKLISLIHSIFYVLMNGSRFINQ